MRDAVSLSFYCTNGGGGDVPSGSVIITPDKLGELVITYDEYKTVSGNNVPSKITVAYADNDTIPDHAFRSVINSLTSYSYITECNLPNTIKKIGKYAFYGDQTLDMNLPANIQDIDEYAFRYCTQLNFTEIPRKIKTIGAYAFANCTKLSSITFLGTPTSIASNAFANCTNLTSIKVPWMQGTIADAPWGATGATITYNYQGA